MENSVDENTIFAVADHKEVGVVEKYFQVSTGYKTRMSHIHVDVAPRGVPADDDPFLSDVVFEIPAFQTGYGIFVRPNFGQTRARRAFE